MREEDLTDPERRLWQAFATGDKVDLRDRAADEDGSDGSTWGPERTVRAAVIRSLLLGSVEAQAGETPVVHLVGARISGSAHTPEQAERLGDLPVFRPVQRVPAGPVGVR